MSTNFDYFVVICCDLEVCAPFECISFLDSLRPDVENETKIAVKEKNKIFLMNSRSFTFLVDFCSSQSPVYFETNIDCLVNCYESQSNAVNEFLSKFPSLTSSGKLIELNVTQKSPTDIGKYCKQILLQRFGVTVEGFSCKLLSCHSQLFASSVDHKISLFYAGNFAPIHCNHIRVLYGAIEMLKSLNYNIVKCYVYVGSDEYCSNKLSMNLEQKDRVSLVSIALQNCEIPFVVISGDAADSFEDVSLLPKKMEKELGHEVLNVVGGDAFCYLHEKYGRSVCVNDPARSHSLPEDHFRSDIILISGDFPRFSSTQFRSLLRQQRKNTEFTKVPDSPLLDLVPDAVLHSIIHNFMFPELCEAKVD